HIPLVSTIERTETQPLPFIQNSTTMSDSVLFVIEMRTHRSRRNVVSAITKYAAPAELLFPPAGGEKDASLEPETKFTLTGTICDPKLEWRRIAAPKASMIEMFVL